MSLATQRWFAVGESTAIILLTACSANTSKVPAFAPMTHAATARMLFMGIKRDPSCPPRFANCVNITYSSPAHLRVCITYDGSCPGPFVWTWTETIVKVESLWPYSRIVGSIAPNPGKPIVDTISERKPVKSSHGEYKYEQLFKACSGSLGCVSGAIGISTSS
jgi:hypothetical protein